MFLMYLGGKLQNLTCDKPKQILHIHVNFFFLTGRVNSLNMKYLIMLISILVYLIFLAHNFIFR